MSAAARVLERLLFAIEATAFRVKGYRHRFRALGGIRQAWFEARGTRHDRPAIVAQHGIGARGSEFAVLGRMLRRVASRVYVPDLAIHGYAGDLSGPIDGDAVYQAWSALIDQFVARSGPVAIYGNSLGGGAAIRYAIDRPANVRALLLASPAGAMTTTAELREILSVFDVKTIAQGQALMRRVFHHPPPFATSSLVGYVLRHSFSRPRLRELVTALKPSDLFTAEQLARVQAPTLLLWGKHDGILPREQFDTLRAQLPADRTVAELVDNAGHSLQHDASTWFCHRLDRFFDIDLPALPPGPGGGTTAAAQTASGSLVGSEAVGA